MTVSPIASQKCMSAADSAAADSGAGFYTDCRAVRFEGGQRAEGRGWRARQAEGRGWRARQAEGRGWRARQAEVNGRESQRQAERAEGRG